jgi:chromosome segregation protein
LQDFLAWTQFIIVTHSKKTMTCANSIYGVTMQESGVSKQVSVSFEDVSEDGRILPERLKREANGAKEKEDAA